MADFFEPKIIWRVFLDHKKNVLFFFVMGIKKAEKSLTVIVRT